MNQNRSYLFDITRLKLTIGYTAFFSVVIIIFSLAFHTAQMRTIQARPFISEEIVTRLQRHAQQLPAERRLQMADLVTEELHSVTQELQQQLRRNIIMFDLISIGGFLIVSYILAGWTLRPVEEAYRTQQQFLADASHELRTPLSVMRAEVDVALREKKLPGKLKEALASLQEEMVHMTQLVNDILFLARTGKVAGTKKTAAAGRTIDLSTTVADVVAQFQKRADQKQISLTAQLPSQRLDVPAGEWERVVTILVDNALKYTPEGGQVVCVASRVRGKVQLQVQDTGVGISADDQERIFDRFYRADSARASEGVGLGLAIAYKIVTDLGGEIRVSSESGQGSIFTIRV